MSANKKKGRVIKSFGDAGTEQRFEKGETHDFSAGAFANYHAGGLIESVADGADKSKAGA